MAKVGPVAPCSFTSQCVFLHIPSIHWPVTLSIHRSAARTHHLRVWVYVRDIIARVWVRVYLPAI